MKLHTLALFALGASAALLAQEPDKPLTLGLKVGIPITDMFSANNTSLFNDGLPGAYSAHTARYILGVSGEFQIPRHLRLEVDALYKRAGFATSSPYDAFGNLGYYNTTLNDWEIPALIKTNITLGHFRPFVDAGAALRHISTIKTDEFLPQVVGGIVGTNSTALHNRNSYGGVAGIGITFKKGPFELSPEVRYTRWANQSFQTAGLRTNLDQGDFLLGISF